MVRARAWPVLGFCCFVAAGAGAEPLPMPRPGGEAEPEAGVAPMPRPRAAEAPAAPTRTAAEALAAAEGAVTAPVCGRAAIVGVRLPRIAEPGGCGIARPVRVEAVAGVALEPPAVIACETARTLGEWIEEVAVPAFGEGEGRLVGLGIVASYVCRNVNYAEEGELSEHARGHAVDIARFERADAATVSVLEDWGRPPWGGVLRRLHREACGIFGTAIGPDSDDLHADHVHYDIAERRRPYCP